MVPDELPMDEDVSLEGGTLDQAYDVEAGFGPALERPPSQAGMFPGAVTFLQAEVDPNGSAGAAEAIQFSEIRGDNIVRGVYPYLRAPLM